MSVDSCAEVKSAPFQHLPSNSASSDVFVRLKSLFAALFYVVCKLCFVYSLCSCVRVPECVRVRAYMRSLRKC